MPTTDDRVARLAELRDFCRAVLSGEAAPRSTLALLASAIDQWLRTGGALEVALGVTSPARRRAAALLRQHNRDELIRRAAAATGEADERAQARALVSILHCGGDASAEAAAAVAVLRARFSDELPTSERQFARIVRINPRPRTRWAVAGVHAHNPFNLQPGATDAEQANHDRLPAPRPDADDGSGRRGAGSETVEL